MDGLEAARRITEQSAVPIVILTAYESSEIKTLKGIIPLCCVCGVIRDDSGCEHGKGKWMKIDQYLVKKTSVEVSHTYCPECFKKEIGKQG